MAKKKSPNSPERASKLVTVARIRGARGVHGDVRIASFTEEPETLIGFPSLLSEDGSRTFRMAGAKLINGDVVARLDGVETREDAIALKGTLLCIPREALPDVGDEDEFYQTDLIGLEAWSDAGELIGKVRAIDNYGAGDIVEIDQPSAKSLSLPFTREFIPDVDLEAGRITISIPDEIEGDEGREKS